MPAHFPFSLNRLRQKSKPCKRTNTTSPNAGASKCPPLPQKTHQCLCDLMTLGKTGHVLSPPPGEDAVILMICCCQSGSCRSTCTGSAADEGTGLSAQEASPQFLPCTGQTQTPAVRGQQLPLAALNSAFTPARLYL